MSGLDNIVVTVQPFEFGFDSRHLFGLGGQGLRFRACRGRTSPEVLDLGLNFDQLQLDLMVNRVRSSIDLLLARTRTGGIA